MLEATAGCWDGLVREGTMQNKTNHFDLKLIHLNIVNYFQLTENMICNPCAFLQCAELTRTSVQWCIGQLQATQAMDLSFDAVLTLQCDLALTT